MPTIKSILEEDRKSLPEWFKHRVSKFNRNEFFASRTVFYPGAGIDGCPIELCSSTHAAHAFVYVDCNIPQDEIEKCVRWEGENSIKVGGVRGHKFKGYEVEYSEEIEQSTLLPPSFHFPNFPRYSCICTPVKSFAFFFVLRREAGFDNMHGPKRLAVLFIGDDGFYTFNALYCRNDVTPAPYLVVVVDYGSGLAATNSKFGQGGLLHRIASEHHVLPEWLLVGTTTKPWDGYEHTGADVLDCGREFAGKRKLYKYNSKLKKPVKTKRMSVIQ